MENFNFYSPTEFVFGQNRENEAGFYVKKYGGTKVLLHYGASSAKKSSPKSPENSESEFELNPAGISDSVSG